MFRISLRPVPVKTGPARGRPAPARAACVSRMITNPKLENLRALDFFNNLFQELNRRSNKKKKNESFNIQ